MKLRQLEYVVAVVDHRGFTRAAEALQVAQPSLSQAVRALEAELGVELFRRTSREIHLTAAGEAFVEPCRQVLRDLATARALVDEVAGLRAGHLDLVSLPTLAVDPAAALIGRFRREYPGVSVRLIEPEDAAAVADRVRSGRSELGVTELPVAASSKASKGQELVAHALGSQEYVALVPTSLVRDIGPGPRITLATLARQPLITTPPGTSTRRLLDESLSSAGLEATVAVETDHREAIAPLVRSGAGVAVVPRHLAEAALSKGVETRVIRPRIEREVGLIHRPGLLSPAGAAFVAIATGGRAHRARPAPRRRTVG